MSLPWTDAWLLRIQQAAKYVILFMLFGITSSSLPDLQLYTLIRACEATVLQACRCSAECQMVSQLGFARQAFSSHAVHDVKADFAPAGFEQTALMTPHAYAVVVHMAMALAGLLLPPFVTGNRHAADKPISHSPAVGF